MSVVDECSATALVIGESLVDVDASTGGRFPGGAPMNVAVGLGRLGVDVTLATWLAHDPDGSLIKRHLNDSNVRLTAWSWNASRTSVAVASLDPDGSASYAFDLDWAPALPANASGFDVVHVGSLGMFMEPGGGAVEEFVAHLDTAAALTIDPNIRAGILRDHESAVGRFERLGARAKLIKLSDEDARWLYPQLDPETVVSRLHEVGADIVVITLGAVGSVLSDGRDVVAVDAVEATVADTIGAGDAYMSALIHWLHTSEIRCEGREELFALGAYASAAAAVAVSRRGANPPWSTELAFSVGHEIS